MNKIKYVNEKIEDKCAKLIMENPALIKLIEQVNSLYFGIALEDIHVYGNGYLLLIKGKEINLEILATNDGKIVSINYVKHDEQFISKHRKIVVNESKEHFLRFTYEDKNKNYLISVSHDTLNKGLIINELLDENRSVNNIKDIYYAIRSILENDKLCLKIKSFDEKESLNVYSGEITDYHYLVEDGNFKVLEYFDNGEYYQEETHKRKILEKPFK